MLYLGILIGLYLGIAVSTMFAMSVADDEVSIITKQEYKEKKIYHIYVLLVGLLWPIVIGTIIISNNANED